MESAGYIGAALLLLGILLVAARGVRGAVGWLQRYYMPASVLAGTAGLLLGPQVLGKLAVRWRGEESWWASGIWPQQVYDAWEAMPSLLINVVFAALFLGRSLAGPRTVWRIAGPQVTLGYVMAFGMYVLGFLLAVTLLSPVLGLPPLAGAMLEIGFVGGHGTVAGLGPTFEALGFPEGRAIGMGLATFSIVAAVLIGMIMIRRAERQGVIDPTDDAQPDGGDYEAEGSAVQSHLERQALEPLMFQLGLIAIAIGIGWLIQQGLIWIEQSTWGSADDNGGFELLRHIPLFPLAMIGGAIIQPIIDHTALKRFVSRTLMQRISGAALDLTIASAIATLALDVLGQHWMALAVFAVVAVTWTVVAFYWLAPWLIRKFWFQRGIADWGQSMGMVVTGLLLMQMADPAGKSDAARRFGYKQLLFEPLVGGGLVTSAALPLTAAVGPWPMLISAIVIFGLWLFIAWRRPGMETEPDE